MRAAGAPRPSIPASAKLNDIDPQAWLADVLICLPDHPAKAHSRTPALELASSERRSRCLSAISHPKMTYQGPSPDAYQRANVER
jgi:hypothetical protein